MSKRAPYPVPVREPWPGSPQYWQNLEGRGRPDDPQLSVLNAAEFPKGHTNTPPSDEAWQVSRRGLLGAMAATFAVELLAGHALPAGAEQFARYSALVREGHIPSTLPLEK